MVFKHIEARACGFEVRVCMSRAQTIRVRGYPCMQDTWMDGLLVLALISFLAERGCIWQLLVQPQVVITHRIQIEGRVSVP